MDVQFSRRLSRVDAMATLPRRAPSQSWTRSAVITRACMERLLMRTGTRSWRTRTPTCRSLAAENLFERQCLTLCDLTAEMECTRDIYRVILLRTAASACQSNTPLHFLMLCRSELPSLCSAGRQSTATIQANRNRAFRAVHVLAHLWVQASGLRLPLGGGGKSWRRQSCLRAAR